MNNKICRETIDKMMTDSQRTPVTLVEVGITNEQMVVVVKKIVAK